MANVVLEIRNIISEDKGTATRLYDVFNRTQRGEINHD